MKTNTFRPTLDTLDNRMMPATMLAASMGHASLTTVQVADHGSGHTDAIWVGNQNATNNEAISVGNAPMGFANPDPLVSFRSKIIAENDLRIGDIMLTTGHSATSAVISITTGSVYTHAALYIGNGRVVEAVGTGVREISLKDYLKENGNPMVIRAKDLSQGQMDQLAQFARNQVGKKYDTAGAILSARLDLTKWGGNPNRDSYYCSNLVTSAFKSIGKELFNSIEQTPGDLAERAMSNFWRSVKMEAVGCLKV